ncbi:hypothetical protein NXC14_CH01011 [Rhizobium sp. NXC14]|nr:hypothetical protein NXC14_CH01011 [Rhizobium sp. NXC14]
MGVTILGQSVTKWPEILRERMALGRLAFSLSKRSREESWSLRGWAIAVAAISTGGALLTGALAGWYSWHEQKARLDQSMVATTRAIIKATEYELDKVVALARGLAIAPSLQSGDINSYEKRARALIQPFGYFFVLTDSGSSKDLFDTTVPPGTGYPVLPSEWMRDLENMQTPIVRPLFQRPADGMWTALCR